MVLEYGEEAVTGRGGRLQVTSAVRKWFLAFANHAQAM